MLGWFWPLSCCFWSSYTYLKKHFNMQYKMHFHLHITYTFSFLGIRMNLHSHLAIFKTPISAIFFSQCRWLFISSCSRICRRVKDVFKFLYLFCFLFPPSPLHYLLARNLARIFYSSKREKKAWLVFLIIYVLIIRTSWLPSSRTLKSSNERGQNCKFIKFATMCEKCPGCT